MINGIWEEGWKFVEFWKSRILGVLGGSAILVLFFVEINSRMIQQFIFHTMLSSIIVDYLSNITPKEVKIKINTTPSEVLLERKDSYSNLKKKEVKFDLIEEYVSKESKVRNRKKSPEFPFVEMEISNE